MATFLIGDAINYGWEKMKAFFTLFLMVLGLLLGIQLITILLDMIPGIGVLVFVASLVVSFIFQLGIYRLSLDLIDSKPGRVPTLWSQTNLLPEYIIGTVLYVLIIIGGLILLIVPGIVWAIKYRFYGYLIVDKKMSPMDAIKESGKMTYGHKWHLLGFWFTLLGVNILGALALLVGLFVTIPTTMMADAYVYRALLGKTPAGVKTTAKVKSVAKGQAKSGKSAKKKR
jgi:uncharacterized membrane protein